MSKATTLVCINCTLGGAENLRPVISVKPDPSDGKHTFGVACVHKLPRLKAWRLLNAQEKADWDRASDDLVQLFKEVAHGTEGHA